MARKVSFTKDYDEFITMDNKENRVRNIKQPPEKGNLGGVLDAK